MAADNGEASAAGTSAGAAASAPASGDCCRASTNAAPASTLLRGGQTRLPGPRGCCALSKVVCKYTLFDVDMTRTIGKIGYVQDRYRGNERGTKVASAQKVLRRFWHSLQALLALRPASGSRAHRRRAARRTAAPTDAPERWRDRPESAEVSLPETANGGTGRVQVTLPAIRLSCSLRPGRRHKLASVHRDSAISSHTGILGISGLSRR